MKLVSDLRNPLLGMGSGASGTSYDADATVLFAAWSTAGAAANATRKGHVNTLILALKAASLWTKFDVFFVTAAHASAAATQNWRSPGSHDLTLTNSPTFTVDRGYAGNGTSSGAQCNFNPSIHGVAYTQNSAHESVWCRDSASSAGGLLTIGDGTENYLYPRYSSDQIIFKVNSATILILSSTNAAGHHIGSRTSSADLTGYTNGSQIGTTNGSASAARVNSTVFVACQTAVGFSTHQFAALSYGGGLNGTEAGNFYTALQAYMTAVGA